MNSSQQEFFIIGHRGAAGDYLENSMAGFEHAMSLDIDGIELDIHEHTDELWVIHDPELDRLTTGQGLLAEAPDLSQLHLTNGDRIPTLPQVLDLLWGNIPVNIEIKSILQGHLLMDLLARYPTLKHSSGIPPLLISSFNHRVLLQLREDGCHWPMAPLNHGVPAAVDELVSRLQPWSWHVDNEYVDFDWIAELEQRGIRSMVYTVNDINRARQLRERGVHGVFTDYPQKFAREFQSQEPA